MTITASAFGVDPDSLRAALSALDDAALALTHARARLHEAVADVTVWAPDAEGLAEVRALVETLSVCAARGESEAAELASRLGRAARDYGDAEAAATDLTRGGDAPRASLR